jgi:hypothetical protein
LRPKTDFAALWCGCNIGVKYRSSSFQFSDYLAHAFVMAVLALQRAGSKVIAVNLQAYLHPDSEHWLDWFHITMRITVLQRR